MTDAGRTVHFDRPHAVSPEDQARADYYALLANVFYRAPDSRLLQAIALALALEGEAPIAKAWESLAAAAAVMPEEAVQAEYEALFVGIGKPPVMLYGSFYLAGFMMEKPLAELRSDLLALGFVRDPAVREPEDHLAAVCDVMRALIQGNLARPPADLAAQQHFFGRHIFPWAMSCCSAISAYHQANFYRRAAVFAGEFFQLEKQAFDMP